eukprot:4671082-Pyramimonas_sp.AAC.1
MAGSRGLGAESPTQSLTTNRLSVIITRIISRHSSGTPGFLSASSKLSMWMLSNALFQSRATRVAEPFFFALANSTLRLAAQMARSVLRPARKPNWVRHNLPSMPASSSLAFNIAEKTAIATHCKDEGRQLSQLAGPPFLHGRRTSEAHHENGSFFLFHASLQMPNSHCNCHGSSASALYTSTGMSSGLSAK